MNESNAAVTVEEISPVKKKLLFDINWVDVKKEMDSVFQEVGKTAKIKGFRKGKVPRPVLEMYYKDHVEDETITHLINKHYWDALKEHKISAVGRPEIEQSRIEKEKNFTFTATVETAPVIDPQGYKNLDLEKVEYEVTEEDIKDRLEQYRQMFATMEEVKEERGVREGDFITLDFSGAIDGVKMKELEAENFFLEVGTKRFIPGFEEQLIDVKVGEEKEISVHFPDDYHARDVAGKDAVFSLTVKSIKEKKLPLLDSNFIDNFDKYESLEELKESIRTSLEEQNTMRSQNNLRNLIVAEVLKNNEFDVPPSYVEQEYQYVLADAQRKMSMDGFSREQAEAVSKQMQEQYRQTSIRNVKVAALFNSIAQKESILVKETEIDEKINEIALQSKDYENTKKYLENEGVRAQLRVDILHNKIFQFIEDKSVIRINKNKREDIEEETRK